MAELENKLNKLESYCHELKTGLDSCVNNPRIINPHTNPNSDDKVIQYFLVSVSEARTSLRILSRALTLQLRQVGPKVYDRVSLLLNPYDIKISLSKNPRALVSYLEALLNRAFFEDFENVGFMKSGPNPTLNPIDRCEENFKSFNYLKDLCWEEVLNKGTKHFSEEFSKFCDRKMSEVVTMLGWTRAWPEPLLQSFFNGSKSVWLVHLLANSVHPSLNIFRVDKGVKFDSIYMEDATEAKAQKLVPDRVRIMVAPGFYVGNNVVKCKVLCRYHGGFGDKGLTPSPI